MLRFLVNHLTGMLYACQLSECVSRVTRFRIVLARHLSFPFCIHLPRGTGHSLIHYQLVVDGTEKRIEVVQRYREHIDYGDRDRQLSPLEV